MATDTIVAEVRQARDALAKRFDYDLRAMLQDAKARQASSGRLVVSFPPRPARKPVRYPSTTEDLQHAGVAEPG
jgi:hypothetical protein